MRIFHIDAFAAEPFGGNPAAVCLLDAPRPAAWMQCLAAELNLSETAFVSRRQDGAFDLRWFTPTVEVPLCGHATLASAHALWEAEETSDENIVFHSASGPLHVQRRGELIAMDFPASPVSPRPAPASALAAIGVEPRFSGRTAARGGGDRDYLLELDSETRVRAVRPDFGRLGGVESVGWIVTAPSAGPEQDFVSRYFAPAWGIDEDPVTGAAHCALVPYWSDRLGKTAVTGYQASKRGGRVMGEARGERVGLAGSAVTVLRGELRI